MRNCFCWRPEKDDISHEIAIRKFFSSIRFSNWLGPNKLEMSEGDAILEGGSLNMMEYSDKSDRISRYICVWACG